MGKASVLSKNSPLLAVIMANHRELKRPPNACITGGLVPEFAFNATQESEKAKS